jgi:hypothetical protein
MTTGRRTALLTFAAVAFTMAPAVGAAQPGTGASADQIAFLMGDTVQVANPDGTNAQVLSLPAAPRSMPTWSPDGSRYVYEAVNGNLYNVRTSGSRDVASIGPGTDPTWAPFGALFFSHQGRLKFIGMEASNWHGPLFPPTPGAWDSQPTVNRSGRVVFTRGGGGQDGLYRYDLGGEAPPVLMVAGGSQASFAPSGESVAYIQGGQLWIANADGTGPRRLTDDTNAMVRNPAWSPDGSTILFVRDFYTLATIDVASGTMTQLGLVATDTAWQPVGANSVVRVWGQDHVDTAVAASQYNFVTAGETDPRRVRARAVVLSRDDTFLDALVGSAFAVKESAPLLITNRLALDSRVQAEINRVLGGSGTVYLLGGELALAPAVQDRLRALGYQVERIWGQTHFDTAIALDRRISPNPRTVIVTTGTNYYDALAAGAAAGANPGTVIVLTDHARMPASSADYLNTLTPASLYPIGPGTKIITAGGPGDAALLDGWDSGQLWPDRRDLQRCVLVGENEVETARMIAKAFFPVPHTAAVATNRAWFDALTGGAMIGFNHGPLLITDPNAPRPVRDYLSLNSGNLWNTVLLGGPAALPRELESLIGEAISLPGRWHYGEVQPGTPPDLGNRSFDELPPGLVPDRLDHVGTVSR